MDVKRKRDQNDKDFYTVTDPKFQCQFFVRKSNDGFLFYEIGIDKGNVPEKLKGMYTRPEEALKDLKFYIETSKPSNTTKRKEMAERMIKSKEERDAAKSKSKDNDELQQGASN